MCFLALRWFDVLTSLQSALGMMGDQYVLAAILDWAMGFWSEEGTDADGDTCTSGIWSRRSKTVTGKSSWNVSVACGLPMSPKSHFTICGYMVRRPDHARSFSE